MSTRTLKTFIIGAALLFGEAARAQPTFRFDLEGESVIQAPAGTRVVRRYSCTLTHAGDGPGASGWCLGVQARNAKIKDIDIPESIRELIDCGSQTACLTTGPGNEGAVSCVVLSRNRPVSLPPNSTRVVAKIKVEFPLGADCDEALLAFVDGLVPRGGDPVENSVTSDGQKYRPAPGTKLVSLVPEGVFCANANPDGWIRGGAWNMLLPLGNRYGCDGGGAANLLRSWVAPRELTKETPLAGTEWPDLDFQGKALASGFEAANFYRALGLSGAPIWVSLAWLEKTGALVGGTCDPPGGLDCDLVDFRGIVERLNGLAPDLRIPTMAADNVLAVAQTYVAHRGLGPRCVDVCTSSDDSIQVWVNDRLVTSQSACRSTAADCQEKAAAILEPGVNKITVLLWQGSGDWSFRLGLADPESGIRLSNANQEEVFFAGADPGEAVLSPAQPIIERFVENADACPLPGPVLVMLKGSGLADGAVTVTESYETPGAMATISEISHNGILGIAGGRPFVTWQVAATDLERGITYQVDIPPGETAIPAGTVNDCAAITGAREIRGSLPNTGRLGRIEDSHDIGEPGMLAAGPGDFKVGAGADGREGTLDDLYAVQASGESIGDGGDGFRFGYQRRKGDFSATVRIAERQYPESGGRRAAYGLMARLDCSPTSKYSLVHANLEADPGPEADHRRGDGVFYQFRRSHRFAGDGTTASMGFAFPDPDGDGPEIDNQPTHFRLVRRGRVLTGYASLDGVSWKLIGSDTWYSLAPDATLLVGFAFTKHTSAPLPGKVTITDFEIGEPDPPEIFDNDDESPGSVVYTLDFDDLPDLGLPPGAVANCEGCPDGGFFPRVVNGRLRLSQEGVAGMAASVFLPIEVPVGSGAVVIEYTAFASHSGILSQPPVGDPNPGDGLTLTLVAGPEKELLGAAGGGLGYEGLTRSFASARPSLAIEADTRSSPTFFNEGTGSPENDGAWHLGINAGATVHCVALNSSGLPDLFSPSGVRHRVVYTSDGKVSVFLTPGGQVPPGGEAGGGAGVEAAPPAAEEDIEPLSSGGEASASVGFTAATGEATQTSEIDDLSIIIIPCSDRSEVARISGPTEAKADTEVILDASASDAGPDPDPDEGSEIPPLSYQWTVEGDAVIEGDSNGPVLILRTGSPVDDGEAICRLAVDDRRCSRPAPAFAEHRVKVIGLPPSWQSYDANDDAALNITDAVNHLNFLFGGGQAPPCQTAMDFDGDGARNITDPIAALNFLFAGGAPPALGEGCQSQPSCPAAGSCLP